MKLTKDGVWRSHDLHIPQCSREAAEEKHTSVELFGILKYFMSIVLFVGLFFFPLQLRCQILSSSLPVVKKVCHLLAISMKCLLMLPSVDGNTRKCVFCFFQFLESPFKIYFKF